MHTDKNNISEELVDKIILTAYGDIDPKTKQEVLKLIENNDAARKIYFDHKRTYLHTKNMKFDKCPDEIIQKVEEKIRINKIEKSTIIEKIISTFYVSPAKTYLFSAAIISIIIFGIFFGKTSTSNNYDVVKAEMANKQAQITLVQVGSILNSTSSTLINDILPDKVSDPLNESLKKISKLFNNGEKNEKSD